MSDNLQPGLGTTIGISATLPTTEDTEAATGYPSLTLINIAEVSDIPSFGPAHDLVEFTSLESGIVAKYHGALNNGSITVPLGRFDGDTGQAALKTALADKARVAFGVTYADGAIDYFQGKVMSFTRATGIGSVITAEVQIEIETKIVEEAAPV